MNDATQAQAVLTATRTALDGVLLGVATVLKLTIGEKTLGVEFQVNTYTYNRKFRGDVASSTAGDFVIVWTSYQDDTLYDVIGQRYDSAGAASGNAFVVNSYTSDGQYGAAVAKSSGGDFVAVWSSYGQDGDGYGVFGRKFASDGTRLGAEFQINSYTPFFQLAPKVALAPKGAFEVVWVSDEQDGSVGGIFGRRFDSNGNALGSEFQVETYTSHLQHGPVVAVESNGDFMVSWDSILGDGSDAGVLGQRFASDGNRIGGEFQINTYTPFAQSDPDAAVAPDGGFTVVWASAYQDGPYLGIFGQRYASRGANLGTESKSILPRPWTS